MLIETWLGCIGYLFLSILWIRRKSSTKRSSVVTLHTIAVIGILFRLLWHLFAFLPHVLTPIIAEGSLGWRPSTWLFNEPPLDFRRTLACLHSDTDFSIPPSNVTVEAVSIYVKPQPIAMITCGYTPSVEFVIAETIRGISTHCLISAFIVVLAYWHAERIIASSAISDAQLIDEVEALVSANEVDPNTELPQTPRRIPLAAPLRLVCSPVSPPRWRRWVPGLFRGGDDDPPCSLRGCPYRIWTAISQWWESRWTARQYWIVATFLQMSLMILLPFVVIFGNHTLFFFLLTDSIYVFLLSGLVLFFLYRLLPAVKSLVDVVRRRNSICVADAHLIRINGFAGVTAITSLLHLLISFSCIVIWILAPTALTGNAAIGSGGVSPFLLGRIAQIGSFTIDFIQWIAWLSLFLLATPVKSYDNPLVTPYDVELAQKNARLETTSTLLSIGQDKQGRRRSAAAELAADMSILEDDDLDNDTDISMFLPPSFMTPERPRTIINYISLSDASAAVHRYGATTPLDFASPLPQENLTDTVGYSPFPGIVSFQHPVDDGDGPAPVIFPF